MQATTEVKVHNNIEFIYDRTLVHVLVESTQPRRHAGQGLNRLVCGRRSGRRRWFHIS